MLTCSRGVGSAFQDALIIGVITNCYEYGTLQMMVSGYPDTRRMKLFWQLVLGKGWSIYARRFCMICLLPFVKTRGHVDLILID